MRHHPDACKHLLEMLLKVKIEQMEMHNEEVIELDRDAKGIRLDVFVKDSKKMYDVELQMTDTKELPERARYYQGVMDLDTLKAGQKYKDLRDSHVIFICLEDIFHNGLPVSTFENICVEDGRTKLDDRAYKHFFFAKACAKMIEDEEVRSFFQFLISNRARNEFTSDLKDYVTDAKHNMQWRFQFMTWERQRAYDYDDGKAAGIKQKAEEDARSFYANGASIELIAKSLGMTIEQVEDIVKDSIQKET
jgi:predicted transposase/invertase (TIGR01784 family)